VQGELREKAVDYLCQAGLRAAARSALDGRVCFEQALTVLAALPKSQATLEQTYKILIELRAMLSKLGEARQALQRLHEAEAVAATLDAEGERGHVCAGITYINNHRGELDEALITGSRASAIAEFLGDVKLGVVSASALAQTHYYRGDYERVVKLVTDIFVATPADVYES